MEARTNRANGTNTMHLADVIEDDRLWSGVKIRYEFPHVDRVWIRHNGIKICLHKIYPIDEGNKPYYHPHPWEFETEVISGSYLTSMGYSNDFGLTPPPVSCRMRAVVGTKYWIDAKTWHTVEPVDEPVYTIIKLVKKVVREVPVECQRMDQMKSSEIASLLQTFRKLLNSKSPSSTCWLTSYTELFDRSMTAR